MSLIEAPMISSGTWNLRGRVVESRLVKRNARVAGSYRGDTVIKKKTHP